MRDFAAWIDFPMNKVSDKVKELQQLVGSFNLTCPAKRCSRWGEWRAKAASEVMCNQGEINFLFVRDGQALPSSFNSISFLSDTGTTEPMFIIKITKCTAEGTSRKCTNTCNLHGLNFCRGLHGKGYKEVSSCTHLSTLDRLSPSSYREAAAMGTPRPCNRSRTAGTSGYS